jgi:hypothetical protein
LSRDVIERRERLNSLLAGRGQQSRDIYSEELAQIDDELAKDSDRLRDYVRELEELGVELKNPPEGLIDFRCLMDGRVVYLCWKLDEPAIQHWHELDAGFAGRHSLPREWREGHQSTADTGGTSP